MICIYFFFHLQSLEVINHEEAVAIARGRIPELITLKLVMREKKWRKIKENVEVAGGRREIEEAAE